MKAADLGEQALESYAALYVSLNECLFVAQAESHANQVVSRAFIQQVRVRLEWTAVS